MKFTKCKNKDLIPTSTGAVGISSVRRGQPLVGIFFSEDRKTGESKERGHDKKSFVGT